MARSALGRTGAASVPREAARRVGRCLGNEEPRSWKVGCWVELGSMPQAWSPLQGEPREEPRAQGVSPGAVRAGLSPRVGGATESGFGALSPSLGDGLRDRGAGAGATPLTWMTHDIANTKDRWASSPPAAALNPPGHQGFTYPRCPNAAWLMAGARLGAAPPAPHLRGSWPTPAISYTLCLLGMILKDRSPLSDKRVADRVRSARCASLLHRLPGGRGWRGLGGHRRPGDMGG